MEMIEVNGNPFPAYEGKPLSWSIGLYHTVVQEQLGFPKARAVIKAMKEHRPEQFEQEYRDYLRASFDKMFGHNATKILKLIEAERCQN